MFKNYKKGLSLMLIAGIFASSPVIIGQNLLDANSQPKFVNPLPIPSVMQPTTVNGTHYEVSITQFNQDLGLKNSDGSPMFTTVWGYNGSYPGPTIEARQGVPISVRWKNELIEDNNPLPHLLPVDTTIHWAHPENWPYSGVPVVTHLHGGYVESDSDGNPNAWFTPDYTHKGSFWSQEIYHYPNNQEAATIWYHDHALGLTRLNVYAGLAGYYIIRNEWEDNLNLPSGNYEIPIAIQDRMFTTDGQLYYPSAPEEPGQPNPSILPEMFGDFILVNGKTWPILNVEPRKYRFRFLNGSDSRFYRLYLGNATPFIQIGTDGGLLNEPVTLNQLLLGPGERKDVIIDFSNPALWNQTIILKNNARSPFPMGETVDPQTVGQIMAFRVDVALNGVDTSVIPTSLRQSPIAMFESVDNSRQLLLIETEDEYDRLKPQLGTSALGPLNFHDPITENPMLDDIEEWEIINFTEDAHPIHLHLVNFQIVNRQKFNKQRYVPGNPSSLQMLGQSKLPTADEKGWKDTAIMYPGEVTRIRAKFDNEGLYLWHCHILSHEDHEMMRPFYVGSMPSTPMSRNSAKGFKVQVTPNPFNTNTTIKIEIGESGLYDMKLYNVNGQFITTLTNSFLKSGTHEISWDGTDANHHRISAGTYILQVQGREENQTFKIVVER